MCNEMAGGVYILHTYIFFKIRFDNSHHYE